MPARTDWIPWHLGNGDWEKRGNEVAEIATATTSPRNDKRGMALRAGKERRDK